MILSIPVNRPLIFLKIVQLLEGKSINIGMSSQTYHLLLLTHDKRIFSLTKLYKLIDKLFKRCLKNFIKINYCPLNYSKHIS